jgi:beta-phosphoglucomutase
MTEVIKGFFFDLDGTLVNTHEANFRAYRQAIREVVGKEANDELKERIMRGESSSKFIPSLIEDIPAEQMLEIQKKKKQIYPKHLGESQLNEFLSSFLRQMSEYHVTALVTTAKRESAEAVLEVHGLKDFFDFCIFGEDVEITKPHPEAYQRALKRAQLNSSEVIAFEDSESGMRAATQAGIRTIQIRSFYDA